MQWNIFSRNLMSPFHSLNLDYSAISMFLLMITLIFLKFKIINVMFIIFLLNLMGLIPDMWSPTCYLWSNILLGFFMWTFMSMNKIFNNLKFWSSHMLPVGSPLFLWSFLVILEILSQMIRPLTLSLRLTCNLMTGHVLLSLVMISNYLILLIFILMFEMCVALIQSVVFSLLLNSYKSE